MAGDRDGVDALLNDEPGLLDRARTEHADLLVHAAAGGRPEALAMALEFGFSLALPDGSSALHNAAAVGDLQAIEVLLGAGADPALRDPLYRSTPAGWAEFFGRREAATLLERATATATTN